MGQKKLWYMHFSLDTIFDWPQSNALGANLISLQGRQQVKRALVLAASGLCVFATSSLCANLCYGRTPERGRELNQVSRSNTFPFFVLPCTDFDDLQGGACRSSSDCSRPCNSAVFPSAQLRPNQFDPPHRQAPQRLQGLRFSAMWVWTYAAGLLICGNVLLRRNGSMLFKNNKAVLKRGSL